jgi:N6-adenosine-specific RNA methylase IME4
VAADEAGMTARRIIATPQEITQDWVRRINGVWQQGVSSIIETGRLLTEAKAALPHGSFLKMIDAELPFSASTAQRLMIIAADPKILRSVQHLPPHWGTIYECTKLSEPEFEAKIADGTIAPDMERRDISTEVKQARRAEREQQLGERVRALPEKKYGVILADPEWRFEPWSRETGMDRAADNHYPTSCTEVIAARDVPSIAADDCVLFLWGTIPMLPHALLVMAAWGFDYVSNYAWGKDKIGPGYWNREKHEHLLIGTRGKIPCPAPGTQWDSFVMSPRGEHSEKPERFLQMIETYFPTLPKIELNRRGAPRPGWDAWGNEADDDEEAA